MEKCVVVIAEIALGIGEIKRAIFVTTGTGASPFRIDNIAATAPGVELFFVSSHERDVVAAQAPLFY
ncbi:MAG TPA: hypothetical protein DEB39_08730 [Planctomycetaceae bacterium]|nr:hypothetical protein [Planctomycetaceae bacterium]